MVSFRNDTMTPQSFGKETMLFLSVQLTITAGVITARGARRGPVLGGTLVSFKA